MAGGGGTSSGGSECVGTDSSVDRSILSSMILVDPAALPLALPVSPSLVLQPSHICLSFPVPVHHISFSLGHSESASVLYSQES